MHLASLNCETEKLSKILKINNMNIKELIILAINSLRSNLFRTILTMLGIIIGIGAVIAIIAVGDGATQSVVDQVSGLGTNIISISAAKQRMGGIMSGSSDSLTMNDFEAIKKSGISNIDDVTAIVSSSKTVAANKLSTSSTIIGVQSNYIDIYDLTVQNGSFISSSQEDSLSRIAVIGYTVSEELFGEGINPVGQKIKIDSTNYKIVGLLDEVGESGFNNPDESIFIPINTAEKIAFGVDEPNSIIVLAVDSEQVENTISDLENLMLKEHNIDSMDDADYTIRSAQEMVSTLTNITGTLTLVLAIVAAISLLVGGIGIMNIMMVIVTERTREIGLLKAIGATNKNILIQFLIEAIVVTLTGGFIGTIIGVFAAYLGSNALGIPFIIKTSSILISVGIATVIGVVFGYYPARKAAKLNPIDALRYE